MKKVILSKKIKSIYILNSIFDYIRDVNFKMKLFFYSKFFQKKLGFNLLNYQEEYLNKIGINYYNYLKYNENTHDYFNKKFLEEKLQKDLSKYNSIDLNIFSKISIKYFKNNNPNKEMKKIYSDYNYNNCTNEIDIYSPFFDSLSNNQEIFENFSIIIPTKYFNKNELKKDYISTFDKLNKMKSKYNSITIYAKDNDDINELKKINIHFNQIKKLAINIDGNKFNYDKLFDLLFSFNIKNNLIYLFLSKIKYQEIDPKSFEKLNEFPNLGHLSLIGINFKDKFKLKLSKLKILSLYKCENILFDQIICLNLKKLYLYNSNLHYNSYPRVKFPKVEECELIDKCSEVSHYNIYIDFSGFESLKTLKIEDSDFFQFKNVPLENLTVFTHSFQKRSVILRYDSFDKNVIEKIISLKSLKKVNFKLNFIKDDILEINDMNTSVTKMKLFLQNHQKDFIYNLQNKFPNLSKLSLLYDPDYYTNDNGKELEIKENEKYKINNIKLITDTSNIKLYCGPYENLIKINIECLNKINNIKNILPIFDNKCDVIFINLNYFRFIYHPKEGINSDILDNLYNNIDKLPNLKFFEFVCTTLDDSDDFYKKFKKKLINLKLNKFFLASRISKEKS